MPNYLIDATTKQRTDTEVNWTTENPVLLQGEIGYVSDKNLFKVGDGVKTYTELPFVGDSGKLYTGKENPTTTNLPASQWTTDEDKQQNVGVKYVNISDVVYNDTLIQFDNGENGGNAIVEIKANLNILEKSLPSPGLTLNKYGDGNTFVYATDDGRAVLHGTYGGIASGATNCYVQNMISNSGGLTIGKTYCVSVMIKGNGTILKFGDINNTPTINFVLSDNYQLMHTTFTAGVASGAGFSFQIMNATADNWFYAYNLKIEEVTELNINDTPTPWIPNPTDGVPMPTYELMHYKTKHNDPTKMQIGFPNVVDTNQFYSTLPIQLNSGAEMFIKCPEFGPDKDSRLVVQNTNPLTSYSWQPNEWSAPLTSTYIFGTRAEDTRVLTEADKQFIANNMLVLENCKLYSLKPNEPINISLLQGNNNFYVSENINLTVLSTDEKSKDTGCYFEYQETSDNVFEWVQLNKSNVLSLIDMLGSESETRLYNDNLLQSEIEGKQDELVSGTNIKTVNGVSVLGSGNIITPDTKVTVNNTLTSTSTTEALSAAQGKALNDNKQANLVSGTNIKTVNGTSILGTGNITTPNTIVPVINNLTSTATTSALSAAQGRTLNTTKQANLVSGTNIKTINEQSLLGSGNLSVPIAYDYVVETQAQWNTLTASSTWLGHKTILIKDVQITHTGASGVQRAFTIPSNVTRIDGIGDAKITLTLADDGLVVKFGIGCQTSTGQVYLNGLHIVIGSYSGDAQFVGIHTGDFCISNCIIDINPNANNFQYALASLGSNSYMENSYINNITNISTALGHPQGIIGGQHISNVVFKGSFQSHVSTGKNIIGVIAQNASGSFIDPIYDTCRNIAVDSGTISSGKLRTLNGNVLLDGSNLVIGDDRVQLLNSTYPSATLTTNSGSALSMNLANLRINVRPGTHQYLSSTSGTHWVNIKGAILSNVGASGSEENSLKLSVSLPGYKTKSDLYYYSTFDVQGMYTANPSGFVKQCTVGLNGGTLGGSTIDLIIQLEGFLSTVRDTSPISFSIDIPVIET